MYRSLINTGQVTSNTFTYLGTNYTDCTAISSWQLLNSTDLNTLSQVVQANPHQYATGASGGILGLQDPMNISATNFTASYNTLNSSNSVPSGNTYLPEIMKQSIRFLIEYGEAKLEFRNQSNTTIWVEMWEALPRRDFPLLIGRLSQNAAYYGPALGILSNPEYLYRLGVMGNLIANTGAQTGGGTSTNVPSASISARPGNDISCSLKECGYYNKWFKTKNFRKILVQPGGTWDMKVCFRNKWVDMQRLRTELFTDFVGYTHTLMWRIYGNTAADVTSAAVVSAPGIPYVNFNGTEKYTIKFQSDPRSKATYVIGTNYGNPSGDTINTMSAVTNTVISATGGT